MSDPRIDEALTHMQAARWPEAAELLEAVVAEAPDEPRALRLLGTMHHLAGRQEEAIGLLERSAAVAPGDPDTTTNLGSAYLALGRADDALRCFEEAVEMQPHSPEARFNLAVTLQQLGRIDDAETRYREILESSPDYIDAWINLSALLLLGGSFLDCAGAADSGLAHDPQSFRLHVLRGRALRQLGQLDESARHVAEALRLAPDDAHVALEEGNLQAAIGRLPEALETYRGVLARAPEIDAARLEMAQVLSDMGRPEDAVEAIEQLTRRETADAGAWAMLGRLRQDLGDPQASLEAYERAVAAAPQLASAHAGMAASLLALGREDAADRELLRTIELDPFSAHAHVARAQLAMRRGAYHAALEICDGYLEHHPSERSMLAAKIMLLQQLDRAEEARRLLDLDGLLREVEVEAPEGYADLGAFNAALAAHVRAHPSLSSQRARIATRGGLQTGNLLVEPKGPFADFERLLWTQIERYMGSLAVGEDHPFLREPPNLIAIYCWSVVMQRAGHQIPHIHPAGWLSGVYYPELPAVMDREDSTEGWIEFGTAPDDLPVTDNVEMAVRAAKAIGLDVAGVDFLCTDITESHKVTRGAICEVNAAPGFRMHVAPTEGEPRDVAGKVMDMLFPPGMPSRIPIAAITGTNGKTTVARMLAHIFKMTRARRSA